MLLEGSNPSRSATQSQVSRKGREPVAKRRVFAAFLGTFDSAEIRKIPVTSRFLRGFLRRTCRQYGTAQPSLQKSLLISKFPELCFVCIRTCAYPPVSPSI